MNDSLQQVSHSTTRVNLISLEGVSHYCLFAHIHVDAQTEKKKLFRTIIALIHGDETSKALPARYVDGTQPTHACHLHTLSNIINYTF